MNDQYYDDFDRGFDAGEEEAGWRADRYIAKLEDELSNQSHSSALSTHAGVLEERVAELEAQVQQIEANRDQLADDFLDVHLALSMATRALNAYVRPPARADDMSILFTAKHTLRRMAEKGYSLEGRNDTEGWEEGMPYAGGPPGNEHLVSGPSMEPEATNDTD